MAVCGNFKIFGGLLFYRVILGFLRSNFIYFIFFFNCSLVKEKTYRVECWFIDELVILYKYFNFLGCGFFYLENKVVGF